MEPLGKGPTGKGPAAGGAAAGGSSPPPAHGSSKSPPVYVSYLEKREPAHQKRATGSKKSGGHTYSIRFFLVDAHGREALAASGEDQGDAHYIYTNEPGFPALYGHNKQEVKEWLERIMLVSQAQAGYTLDEVQDEIPEEPAAARLPNFVAHKQQKYELPDGRHAVRWLLVDDAGHEHAAVYGEEKDTRDGHYSYHTEGIFDVVARMECGNQGAVGRWLDSWVAHQAPPEGMQGAPAGGGGARQGGASKKGGKRHASDLLRHAALKKLKGAAAALHGTGPDAEAREAVVCELRRWAHEEGLRREASKRAALGYVADDLCEADVAIVKRCLDTLRPAVRQAGWLPPADADVGANHAAALRVAGAPGQQRSPPCSPWHVFGGRSGASEAQLRNLVAVLGALRELGHVYAPLGLVASGELKDTLGALRDGGHPTVARLAGEVLQLWLRQMACHVHVLTNPHYAQDPRTLLESRMEDRAELDKVVESVTHRKIQPLDSLPALLEAHWTPAPPTLGAAATPASMSALPSELSLPDLAVPSSFVGEPGTAAPSTLDEGDEGNEAEGEEEEGAIVAQSVERRRLDLGLGDTPASLGSAGLAHPASMARSLGEQSSVLMDVPSGDVETGAQLLNG